MKKIISFVTFVCFVNFVFAQQVSLYPTNWFVGMKLNKVQLLLRSDDPNFSEATFAVKYPGVTLTKTHSFTNGKYVALDLTIAPTVKAGNVKISATNAGKVSVYDWALLNRREGNGTKFAQGVRSEDAVYLLMPDRFSNADKTNDAFKDMRDSVANPSDILLRHGGDLKGVENHLNYIKELGMTSIWMCPIIENDMPQSKEAAGWMSGYHGYWFTDHYKVDKRFGGNEAYKSLSDAMHKNGLKLIQDAVYNHVGDKHWMHEDAPALDWINQWNSYTGSTHREETVYSNNGSAIDKKKMLDGWFVPHLPDVNQRNPYVSNYLVQHAIWTTETFGVDGWRVDTYKYCDEAFMNRVNDALMLEYPKLTIFGETVSRSVTGTAYFTRNTMDVPFKHNVEGVTDFPVHYSFLDAVNQPFSWDNGLSKLYVTLSQDILYKNPLNNSIFLDNHDNNRFLSMVGEDYNKFKMGIGLLYTTRGIPQLYYGTEILMKNFMNPSDAMVRLNFPGGFPGDAVNKFEASGRNVKENDAFNFVKTIANFRKGSPALTKGSTTMFVPKDGYFVYFRKADNQTIMCVVNSNDKAQDVQFSDYAELTNGFKGGKEVVTGYQVGTQFSIPAKQMWIIELNK